MKKFVLAFLLGFCTLAFADPAPFGLELNKATFEEVTRKYPGYKQLDRANKLNGKGIFINANEFELEGIKDYVIMDFDDKNILHWIGFNMSKDKFDSIYNSLRQKYKLVKSEIPFVGDKFVKFENGSSFVMVFAPHLGFDMNVIYLTKKFNNAIEKKTKEQEQAKKQKQNSLL